MPYLNNSERCLYEEENSQNYHKTEGAQAT